MSACMADSLSALKRRAASSSLASLKKLSNIQVETIYMGHRKVSIRTSVLEEKATACNMLCCYVDELKEGFYPYVADVSSPRPC